MMAHKSWHCGCAWGRVGACPHVNAPLPVYNTANNSAGRTVGRRRELLQRFFWEHCAREAFAETMPDPPKGEYCSRYQCDYKISHFEPSLYPTAENPELKMKYPLYTDIGLSFWQEKSKRPSVSQFRRRSFFTTSVDKILEEDQLR